MEGTGARQSRVELAEEPAVSRLSLPAPQQGPLRKCRSAVDPATRHSLRASLRTSLHSTQSVVSVASPPRRSDIVRSVFSPQMAVFINNHTTLQPSSVLPPERCSTDPKCRPRMRLFVLLSQCAMGYVLGALSGALPLARDDLKVGVFTASLWRGGYELFNFLFTVLLLVIASRKMWSTHDVMQIAHAVAIPACVCVLLVDSFEGLLACALVLGASSGFQTASADAFIATVVDTDTQHAFWTSLSMVSMFCGVATGTGTVGVWDSFSSWKWGFAFAGVWLAFVFVLGSRNATSRDRAQSEASASNPEAKGKGLRDSLRALKNAQFSLLTLNEFLERLVTSSLEYFSVLIATETFGVSQERAGALVGGCAFVAGIVGIVTTTNLIHGLMKRREGEQSGLHASHWCFALYSTLGGACVLLLSFAPSSGVFFGLLFFATAFLVGTWGAKITVKVTPYPPEEHPFVLSASQLIKMCAHVIGPLMFGALAQQWSNRVALRVLSLLAIPQTLTSLLSIVALKRQSQILYTEPFRLCSSLADAFDSWDTNQDGVLDICELQQLVHHFLREQVSSAAGLLDSRGRRCKETDVWLTMWSFHFARSIVQRYNVGQQAEAKVKAVVTREQFRLFVNDLQHVSACSSQPQPEP